MQAPIVEKPKREKKEKSRKEKKAQRSPKPGKKRKKSSRTHWPKRSLRGLPRMSRRSSSRRALSYSKASVGGSSA